MKMKLDLDIKLQKKNNVMIIATKGDLDDNNAPKLNDTFNHIIEKDKLINLIINLEETTYIDSVGLGTIALAAKKVAQRKGRLNIACTKPQVIKLLNASGMVSVIKRNIGLFESVREALENFS